jgi:serine/threonine protein kinase
MQLKEYTIFHERYRLIRRLGQGGFSEVWLAEDIKADNKEAALKIYAPGTGLDDDGVKLFSKEFALVFDMNHTNLLKPAHYDIFEQRPYLKIPFCERGSSAKLMGKISEDELWHFFHDVSSGLAYLHKCEPPVIHQDIKPANVLIDGSGSFLITDFGISTKARSTLRKSVIQSETSGTIAYMGPERFGGDNLPIKASDIWALGASVFELITDNPPFGDHGGLLQKGGAEIPNISGTWSADLKKIVALCLEKDPWDRPTAEAIVIWTEQHFRGEPIRFKGGKPSKPKSAKWIVTIVVTIVLLISGAGFWKYYQENIKTEKVLQQELQQECISLINAGDTLAAKGEDGEAMITYNKAIDLIAEKKLNIDTFRRDKLFKANVDAANEWLEIGTSNGNKQASYYLKQALKLKEDIPTQKKLNQLNN